MQARSSTSNRSDLDEQEAKAVQSYLQGLSQDEAARFEAVAIGDVENQRHGRAAKLGVVEIKPEQGIRIEKQLHGM